MHIEENRSHYEKKELTNLIQQSMHILNSAQSKGLSIEETLR